MEEFYWSYRNIRVRDNAMVRRYRVSCFHNDERREWSPYVICFFSNKEEFCIFSLFGEALIDNRSFPKDLRRIKDKKAYVEVFMRLICA